MLEGFASSLIEGRLRRRSRRRSGEWRPAAAACNRSPREAREVARQALRPGCEELAARVRRQCRRRKRGPGGKTATVERREASVPRYGTQGASLGAWRAALCARLTGVPPSTRTFLGAPPTPRCGVSEAKLQTPGAKKRRGNELGCLTS